MKLCFQWVHPLRLWLNSKEQSLYFYLFLKVNLLDLIISFHDFPFEVVL